MKKRELILLAGLILAVILSQVTAFAGQWQQLRSEVVRLHVLANSDSEEDQSLKLKVRDRVLAEGAALFSPDLSRQDAVEAIDRQIERLQQAAQDEVYRQGYHYPVTVCRTKMFFDTRAYDGFVMPAGNYDAVRVLIGDAEGKNWWCVMFPPMCLPAAAQQTDQLEDEILQYGDPVIYKPKLAVVEWWENLMQSFSQKEEAAENSSYAS